VRFDCICIYAHLEVIEKKGCCDGADNKVEENSSIFSLIRTCQQWHLGSKTALTFIF